MKLTYSYYTSNTEGLTRYGDISPLRVYNADITTEKGLFSLRLGMLDQDDLHAGYQSTEEKVTAQDIPKRTYTRDGPVRIPLTLSPFLPDIEEYGLSGDIPEAVRKYLQEKTGMTESDVNRLWGDAVSMDYLVLAEEDVRKTKRTWNKQKFEKGSAHRLIFGTELRQKQYNHTKFLSKFVYDVKLSSFGKDDASLAAHLLKMNTNEDSLEELLSFASFIQSANITELNVFNPTHKTMCVQLSSGKKPPFTSYWVFKGTVASELPAYLVAYAKLTFSPENEINDIVGAINKDRTAQHVLCGHSYGAWLAHTVAQYTDPLATQTFLYNPPASVEKAVTSGATVEYQREYKACATTGTFMQTHPNDPVTYPSLRTLFTLGAHSSSAARNTKELLALGKNGNIDQMYVKEAWGLDNFPCWSALLKELSLEKETVKSRVVLQIIRDNFGDSVKLFTQPAFLRYIDANNHCREDLLSELQTIDQILSKVALTVIETKPKEQPFLEKVGILLEGLRNTGVGNKITQWANGVKSPQTVLGKIPEQQLDTSTIAFS